MTSPSKGPVLAEEKSGNGTTTDEENQTIPDDSEVSTRSPRDDVPPWKWKAMLFMTAWIAFFYGYDVGNTANIQVPIYTAFGHIELLPWVACAFSMASFSTTPIIRRLTGIFNLRYLLVSSVVVVSVGAAITGSAHNMATVIVGRVVNGIGSSITYQLVLSYVAVFASAAEAPGCMSIIGVCWALGLISGPLIGGAFAENIHATWRWALYLNLPVMAALFVGFIIVFPSYTVPSDLSTITQLLQVDWCGAALHIASITLFCVAAISSGSLWKWNSAPAITIWVVWGLVFAAYVAQQRFSFLTTPQRRIFPVELISDRLIGLTALATCCASSAYAVTLYYLPLFFAFAQGLGPIECAVHLLPFIGVFIASAIVSGALLPKVRRYKIFYVLAGALYLVGGALMTTISASSSLSRVLGYEAILGFGLGLIWFHGVSLANAAMKEPAKRFAAAALMNMSQLGPISIGLAIAAAVFQNYGFQQLKNAIGPFGFDDLAIQEALGGVMSPIWTTSNDIVIQIAVVTIVDVIARLFYIILAGGVVCFLAACLMKWEEIDFPKRGNTKKEGSHA